MRFSACKMTLLTALLLVAPASNANPSNLPDLGDESGIVISPVEERKIGERVFRHIRGSPRFVSDPEVNHYIQDLGQKLVAHGDSTDAPFTFFVLEDPTINAFAMPGSFIGMHTGLIMAAQSESEVAGVLAHEIAHITQRHLQRMFAESKRTSRKVLLGMLAALALAAAGESAGAGAAAAVAQAGGIQQQLNFSRANEEEADRVGIEILSSSNLDPQGLPAFFERLQTWGRLNETNLPEFLQTHPVTTNRIADSRARAQRYPYRQVPDTIEFYRVRAKLRARAPNDPSRIVNSFKDNLIHGKYRNLEAERYGYAWALLRVRGYDTAREQAIVLAKDHPNTVFYRILQADV
jgi:predicted Zn-dependent protease